MLEYLLYNIYCIKCQGKSDIVYEILCKSDSVQFYGTCKEKVEKGIITDLKIKARCNEIIQKCEQRVSTLKLTVDKKYDDDDNIRRIIP